MSGALDRLRGLCLALPGAAEQTTWGVPTFRINSKIFALVDPVAGRDGVWVKAPPGAQAILIAAAPERFFRPPYLGHKGWIGIWLDAGMDWSEMEDLVGRSYRMIAPKQRRAGAGVAIPARKANRRRG